MFEMYYLEIYVIGVIQNAAFGSRNLYLSINIALWRVLKTQPWAAQHCWQCP